MHLALGWHTACPAHPAVALSALNVRTSAVVFADGHAALDIRTRLSAMFHKQSSQLGFIVFVTLVDVHQLGFDALGEHVDPVDWASLEGMR